jgi:xanthine dehydrogenase accessory factor
VLGYLADRGVPRAELDKVKVPAGLDLGSTTHPEIAVAILAELVQLRASGALAGGTVVPERLAESQPDLATDPVCGMTVTARPEALPLEHAGVTYYFCGARCRQAFGEDPATHAKRLLA